MGEESYASAVGGVLRAARDAALPTVERVDEDADRTAVLRAAALVAVLSMIETAEDTSRAARLPGTAWTQDHRRTRTGRTNLMTARNQRATWR